MQFHLNGYAPGDPEISPPADAGPVLPRADAMPDEVDVLIVGCGPAGLTLAAQLAVFPGIRTRIVEQKPGPLLVGQADGIACRTMEMFEAFGFSGRMLKEAYWVNETAFWKPDDTTRANIVRSGRIQDTEDGLSEFPHVILNQARVHDFLLDFMRHAPTRLEPDYARRLADLRVDAASGNAAGPHGRTHPPDYPVSVTLERLDPAHEGKTQTVRARFVVGCDGARSTVRQFLGRALHGDSANQAWGVMDVLVVTNFPDIRVKTAIHSGSEGSLLIIPREGGYLVRMYIELDKLNDNERIASRNITADHLVAAASRILHPYTLQVMQIAWWSVYEIGQRICDKFDDLAEHETTDRVPCVFIAGDACHTHSPKAGQGMNVSMQDGFNLGWKLASVLLGRSTPEILHSYSGERQAIANELIEFDREFAQMFSAPPKDPADADSDGIDPADFQKYFVRQGRFTAGTATRYQGSIISGAPTWQHLARGLTIGMRFHSAPVIRLADAKPMQLGHAVKADGRWRLFIFAAAASPVDPACKLQALCDFLARDSRSPVRRYTPADADIDSVFDVRAVFQQDRWKLALQTMPDFLLPQKGRYGLHDYEKIFCADRSSGRDVFDLRGIDRQAGCMVVVRPDQYVGHVLPINAHDELATFFARFMLEQG